MSATQQHDVKQAIAQIIERSRHHEEMFLIDSQTAANHILEYLQKESLMEVDDLLVTGNG